MLVSKLCLFPKIFLTNQGCRFSMTVWKNMLQICIDMNCWYSSEMYKSVVNQQELYKNILG